MSHYRPERRNVCRACRPAMLIFLVPLLLAAAAVLCPTRLAAAGALPYEIQKRTLPNGLDVLVVEMPEFKDVLSFNTMVLAGSRNEVEKGRTGLAHLFEHIAFRHKFDAGTDSYGARMDRIGAFDNAWTWFDVTYYHPATFATHLDALAAVQAERFVAMEFTERIYRTEAGAVLGEYRRIAADPSIRMEEVRSDLAYGPSHGYGHTTMGYLDDVKDMPSSFASGRAFYETWYRPNNAVVVVTGDVAAERVFALVERTYGPWTPAEIPSLPAVEPVGGPKVAHVAWESSVAPRVTFAHLVPPFRPGTRESAVLLLLPELIAGETAPLYRKLRYERRIATSMGVEGRSAQGFDARLLQVELRLDKKLYEERGEALFAEVLRDLEEGLDELKGFSRRDGAAALLANLKLKFRYDFLASLDSPRSLAATLAWYYRFTRDPLVLDGLLASIEEVAPEDVDAFATRRFVPTERVVVTMSPKED